MRRNRKLSAQPPAEPGIAWQWRMSLLCCADGALSLRGDAPQPHRVDLVQGPPAGRCRWHRAEHLALLAQHVDVTDRLPTVGDHHGQVDQHPAPIVTRPPPRRASAPDSASVSPARSARIRSSAVPTCDTTPVPSAVTRKSFAHAVDCTSEVPPSQRNLQMSQSQVSLAAEALPLIYTPTNGHTSRSP